MQLVYLLSAAGLLVYLLVVALLTRYLGLSGRDVWILRIALGLIGAAAAALIVYYKKRQGGAAKNAPQTGGLADDVQFVINEANARLKASYAIRKTGRNLAEFPLVLFLGDANSTKTTIIQNSGTSPELLSGQVGQEGQPLATRACNVWLGANTIFVEAGGALLADEPGWNRLVALLGPRRLANRLGRGAQAPRAVVLCVDAAAMSAGDSASAITAAARRYHDKLGDVSQRWGTRLPVYVLFTKADQVPYFTDYVRNLPQQDADLVVGTTLPMAGEAVGGAYNDWQGQRLTQTFEWLFLSLADKRAVQLRRENDPSKLPNIYEFPREFRKLRDSVVRFLLDVGRPSQLRASAFLRGYYFVGVRPVVVESGPSAPAAAPSARSFDAGATRIFSGSPAAFAQQAAQAVGTRRVPQWIFLKQFFANILLADEAARGTSGADTKASLVRRVLLAAASLVAVAWIAGLTVSWFRNGALIERAQNASRALAATRVQPGAPVPDATLRNLDELRKVAEQLTTYERSGPPLSYRWGLYPGHDLYDNVRATYCRELGRNLLAPTRSAMEVSLAALHTPAAPTDDYDRSFRTLKAYLMTTDNPDKTDTQFLTDALTARWTDEMKASDDQSALARQQFAFYSGERTANFCPAKSSADAVERARAHLWSFQPVERIYSNIITALSKNGPPIRFSDPTGAVVDSKQVAWAFSKDGYPRFQAAVRDTTKYFSQDPWVLGPDRPSNAGTTADLQQQLRQKYQTDFVGQWHAFLNAGNVTSFANMDDATRKLNSITSAQSSLLKLFCLVSTHTAVEAPEIQKEFRSVQQLEAPVNCVDAPNGPATQPYMQALTAMAVQVDAAAKNPDPNVTIDGSQARIAARTTAQNLNLPPKAETLMQQPILQAEALAARKAPEALNGKGADFCRDAANVFHRFPFDPRASDEAKVEDVTALFLPTGGKLWKFYQDSLQELLVQSGPTFSPKPGAKLRVNPAFIAFLNRAAAFAHAAYPGNATRPAFTYRVEARPSPGVDGFQLIVNGKTLNGSGRGGESADFQWTGSGDSIMLIPKVSGTALAGQRVVGTWGVFRLMSGADRQADNGTLFAYDLLQKFGRTVTSQQATLNLRITALNGASLYTIFPTGCVSKIAQ